MHCKSLMKMMTGLNNLRAPVITLPSLIYLNSVNNETAGPILFFPVIIVTMNVMVLYKN